MVELISQEQFPFVEEPRLAIYTPAEPTAYSREYLPARRRCLTQKVKIGVKKQTVYYTFGLYPDGRPGELFIDVAKAGAALRAWANEAGMMLSVALQHHTPLATVLSLFIGTSSEPCGDVLGHPFITKCTSIMDLIAKDMAVTFLKMDRYRDIAKDCEEHVLDHVVASN